MSEAPDDLKYSKSHEWLRDNGDGTITIGITDHAQEQLGDLVYVEVPEPGRELEVGEACAVVESVKAASDVYAPITATVIESNEQLADSPEAINQDAYGAGWLIRVKPVDDSELAGMLDAVDYLELIDSQ